MKTLLVKAVEGSSYPLVALLVRGDHELNEVKAEKLPQVASPLTFATEEEIRALVKQVELARSGGYADSGGYRPYRCSNERFRCRCQHRR